MLNDKIAPIGAFFQYFVIFNFLTQILKESASGFDINDGERYRIFPGEEEKGFAHENTI